MKKLLQMKDLREATGMSESTLAFYSRLGLLPQKKTGRDKYRLFLPEAVDTCLWIKEKQEEGYTLHLIKQELTSDHER